MKSISGFAFAVSILCMVGCSTPPSPSQAKIPEKEAEVIALAQVQGGTIQSSELEREKGSLVWSFNISIPGSKDIREVLVDAQTGKVLALETETPAQQADEAAKDAS